MRGHKKDYETEILNLLGSGPLSGLELKLKVRGMEQNFYLALQNLIRENKIKKESGLKNKYNYSLV